jgi:hypothetical protein
MEHCSTIHSLSIPHKKIQAASSESKILNQYLMNTILKYYQWSSTYLVIRSISED